MCKYKINVKNIICINKNGKESEFSTKMFLLNFTEHTIYKMDSLHYGNCIDWTLQTTAVDSNTNAQLCKKQFHSWIHNKIILSGMHRLNISISTFTNGSGRCLSVNWCVTILCWMNAVQEKLSSICLIEFVPFKDSIMKSWTTFKTAQLCLLDTRGNK